MWSWKVWLMGSIQITPSLYVAPFVVPLCLLFIAPPFRANELSFHRFQQESEQRGSSAGGVRALKLLYRHAESSSLLRTLSKHGSALLCSSALLASSLALFSPSYQELYNNKSQSTNDRYEVPPSYVPRS